jgi:hypothetical protein
VNKVLYKASQSGRGRCLDVNDINDLMSTLIYIYILLIVIKIYYTRLDDPEIDSQNIQGITVHMDGTRKEQVIWN